MEFKCEGEVVGYGWICGHCDRFTTETHFYEDRATGTMEHTFGDRAEAAERCGWRFDDDYGTVERCRLRHGHLGNHYGYHCHWTEWPGNGSIPPATAQSGRADG